MNKLSQKQAEAILSNRVIVSNSTVVAKVRINSVSSDSFAWKNPVAGTNPSKRI